MSTTTEILFNSPALHSLKRDQLVKLCKIHSIKASGKNVDLIAKLKQHAEQLPKDSPLSVAARSEPETATLRDDASGISRQSEQWEVIMDTIEELDEEASQGGTLTSQRTCMNGGTGEFGTGHSKSTKSSIKAIATSLGLKRSSPKSSKRSSSPPKSSETDDDELRQRSTRYSALPPATPDTMPQTDHFVLDTRMSIGSTTDTALPGTSMRPGVPAPPNARLSMGLATPSREAQPTTTIRLVNPLHKNNHDDSDYYTPGIPATPQLKPFATTFDLTFASPAAVWPPPKPGDNPMRGIYPTLTFNDLPPSIPGSPAALRAKSPEPFVFGSPLPRHSVSNDAFRAAAASVLEEMNQRLREDGVDEIEDTIIAKLHPHLKKEAPREIRPMPGAKKAGGEIAGKFQALHEKEFQKMEGIDAVVRKRLQVKKKSVEGEERVVLGKKRKSSVLERDAVAPRRPSVVAGRASTTRAISAGRRAKIPGAFGDDDDDESDAEEEEDQRGGKRVKMDPDAPVSMQTAEEAEKQREAEERRHVELEKEKEAIRKKLEANRMRRRSSVAQGGAGPRKSVGGPRKSLVKPAPKPSRFGFLSSAKNLVANVWNRGKAPAPPVASSSTAKPEPAAKPEQPKAKMGPPSFVPTRKVEPAPARQTSAVASGSKATLKKPSTGADAQASVASRARSPLPTFGSTSGSSLAPSRSSVGMSSSSRTSSSMDTGSKSRMSNVSSMGTKASGARMSTMGSVGSMGTKKVLPPSTSRASVASSSRMSSVTSRLFAPTASSLAKTHKLTPSESSIVKPAARPVVEEKKPIQLDPKPPLANNTGTVASPPASRNPKSPFGTPGAFSPRRGPIFSHPPSAIPTPIKRNEDGLSSSAKETDPQAMSTSPDGLGGAAPRPDAPVRSLNGRKPRISRSRVIARLASQRAAAHGVTSTGATASRAASSAQGKRLSGSHIRRSVGAPRLSSGGKTRSSIGAKVARSSYGGGGGPRRPSVGSVGDGVLMSARKRARQSEYYARRRSRVEPASPGPGSASGSGPSRGT
ncbi:hypothetical protein D9619_009746 [Psilocybe cf. subviscida]|uniref:SAP domain-containing protein n=1 Tax=Psilocybe cf. subviscida TaxID=2480587 RepID=A0A8H5F6M4_9AGAR|nr:hypothetical protein D9619_009746 [Psilocybe cf. subviscida]